MITEYRTNHTEFNWYIPVNSVQQTLLYTIKNQYPADFYMELARIYPHIEDVTTTQWYYVCNTSCARKYILLTTPYHTAWIHISEMNKTIIQADTITNNSTDYNIIPQGLLEPPAPEYQHKFALLWATQEQRAEFLLKYNS